MKKSTIRVSGLLSLFLLLAVAVPCAAVVFVDGIAGNDANSGLGGWGNAKKTIQAGVTVAAGQPDLTVWVRKTTYVENVVVPAGVLVYGGFDGVELPPFDLSTRVFVPATIVQRVAAGNTAFTCGGNNTIDGFTIQAGGAPASGFGVAIPASTTGVVSNCIVQNFQALAACGAGLSIGAGSTVQVSNSTFFNNSALTGACICATGAIGNPIGLTVTACTFTTNVANAGAGIHATNGNVSVNGSAFNLNLAVDQAAAPPIAGASIYTSACGLSVGTSTFTDETARVTLVASTMVQGGAIHASGGTIVSVNACEFDTCVATGTNAVHTAQGGAMYITGVSAMLRNNFLSQCAALGAGTTQPANGGAVFYQNQGTINVFNNTFHDNQVTPNAGLVSDVDRPYGLGSALFLTGSNTANVINNIITHNRGTAVVNQGMAVNFNYNCLWHNAGGDIFGFNFPFYSTNPLLNKDFNIMKDPNLRNPAAGDLHILFGSPCKNAGRNAGAPGTDIDGEVRPWPPAGVVDIGADEFVDTDNDGGADTDPAEVTPGAIVFPEVDPDLDGVYTPYDNCPAVANPTQVDSNGDKAGDACTPLATGATTLVYYVDFVNGSDTNNGTSWATAFKTIQRGIDVADSHNQAGWQKNHEVWVRGAPVDPTYSENVMVWHGVAVYGAWAGPPVAPTDVPDPHPLRDFNTNQTSIDGGAVNPSATLAHPPQDRYLAEPLKTSYDLTETVLDTFRLTNGKGELGGGASVYKDLVNISTCRIDSNTAALGGGAYFYKSNGIVGDGLNPPLATLTTGSTRIWFNTATGSAAYAGYGGGVYTERGSPTIFANLIEGNTAYFGGGIASRRSSPLIIGNLIGCAMVGRANTALGSGAGNGEGGGIYLDNSADAGINKDTIVSNQATGAAGQGGGLYVDNSNFTMKNTIVADNTAGHLLPAQRGGAIFATGTSPAILDPWCWIKYCDFWNNSATQFVGIPDPTTPPPPGSCSQTNFAVNPLFVNPATCDYQLAAGSPLRNAGDPTDGSPNVGAFQDEDPPANVGEAKQFENGVTVAISGVAVTAVYPEGFYVEELDRTAGIFVRTHGAAVQIGQLVDVTGVVSESGIEREVVVPTVTLLFGSTNIRPLSMANRQVGGGPNGAVKGVTGGLGPNNLGLLIQTWGNVTRVESDYFTIDDGSGVGVKVIPPVGARLPAVGTAVVVAGISCVDYSGGKYGRAVRTRVESDLGYPRR